MTREWFQNPPCMNEAIRGLLAQVPAGSVATHEDLAEALGSSLADRWIAEWVLDHKHAADCACHRAIPSSGSPSGCGGGSIAGKIARLNAEGVTVQDGQVEPGANRFQEFQSDRP
ncbi:MAG: MGMT family protein, partial [Planctomycetales bacterium]